MGFHLRLYFLLEKLALFLQKCMKKESQGQEFLFEENLDSRVKTVKRSGIHRISNSL